ncbi:hypothetical protein J8F10_22475 [Gemmata sp. G18]|uniref:Uncharacterized protein n=1 Tax=Gemmata palustris TaxID=2822762 RepID=A0ABS5BWG8_9BACT|nr:hypothetical protein [Gemmata palustris]MBP3958031.1 hypothetical protein [Gemmata palustris]
MNEAQAKVNSSVEVFDQNKLWKGEGRAGQEAYDWFLRRMSEGVLVEQAIADANSDKPKSLAFVNIETVHTRWVNNTSAFLTAADEQVQTRFSVPIADWMKDDERERDEAKNRWKPKAPEGGAWVVEIRGYTDHKGGRRFIEQSLLRNLQRTDTFAKDDAKVGRYIVGVPDPVKGKVSHPFVYTRGRFSTRNRANPRTSPNRTSMACSVAPASARSPVPVATAGRQAPCRAAFARFRNASRPPRERGPPSGVGGTAPTQRPSRPRGAAWGAPAAPPARLRAGETR